MDTKSFETSDTPLATYLTIQGIKLAKLDTSVNPAVFIFQPDSENKIDDFIMAWDLEHAEGNCHAFYKVYRRYIRQIKDAHPITR